MKVSTTTDRVRQIRRGVMELYLSDHPLDGLTSPTAGNSEFQEGRCHWSPCVPSVLPDLPQPLATELEVLTELLTVSSLVKRASAPVI